jgi:hypothetical protein
MTRVPNINDIDAGVAFPELLGLAEVALDVGLVPEGDDVDDMEGQNVASTRKRGDSDKAVVITQGPKGDCPAAQLNCIRRGAALSLYCKMQGGMSSKEYDYSHVI